MSNIKQDFKKINIVSGRNNLSVTVYVPFNCKNNCEFCSSKQEYSKYKMEPFKILYELEKISNSNIEEVVFTGGEPMSDLFALKMMVEKVKNKKVYINTSFLNSSREDFCKFVNETDCIKGINISRHNESFIKDSKMLHDIAEDKFIKNIKKPVKINVVFSAVQSQSFFQNILTRWSAFKNVSVSFRQNFTLTTQNTLHDLNDDNISMLCKFGEFQTVTFCNVCDTIWYKTSYGLNYSYHRGLENTSIMFGNVLQINDIVLYPNGKLAYDWDGRDEYISDVEKYFNINVNTTNNNTKKSIPLQNNQTNANDIVVGTCAGMYDSSSCYSRTKSNCGVVIGSYCGIGYSRC